MKVKSLFIKDYKQFKDFELDLTYPKGHRKEGQPLDKVCIIGQSGTGKTTLLKFVELFSKLETAFVDQGNGTVKQVFRNADSIKLFEFVGCKCNLILNNLLFKVKVLSTSSFSNGGNLKSDDVISALDSIKIKNIFIPAEQNANFNELETKIKYVEKNTPHKVIHNNFEENGSQSTQISVTNQSNFIEVLIPTTKDFLSITPNYFPYYWGMVKNDAKTFQINLLNKRNEFSKLVTDLKTPQSQIQKEVEKLRDWEEKQVNPLKKLADEFLDKILNHFHLKVKTEVDFEDIGFIKVETLQGKEVANDILSTGVKQILLTALPLYALKPENSIILFDEPERSLYPDIQTQIIELYTNLAKGSQFFIATHSPLIASSFEPWEIVELRFNDEGNVYREKYYEDENHIDNYKFYPEYLRYDTILSKVFDLPNEANPKRRKILDEIAILEKHLKNGVSQEEKTVLWEKYQALQKKVNWEEDDEKY